MSSWDEDGDGGPVGTRFVLTCGHRIRVPWDLPPEAGIAELLHHEADCGATLGAPVGRVPVAARAPWLPLAGATP